MIMETNNRDIIYLNKKVKILQYLAESNKQFSKRLEYIKLLEKENINWKEAMRLSKIWYGIKVLNCKYQSDIYNKVMSFEKK